MSSIFNFWNFFFTDSTCWKSFLLENFTITLSFFLAIQWHAWMLQPTFLKTWITFSSKELSSAEQRMPAISRHSLLEYSALAQHCLSKSTTRCNSKLFIFFSIFTSPSNLEKLLFNLRNSSNQPMLSWSIFLCCYEVIEIKPFLRFYLNHIQCS